MAGSHGLRGKGPFAYRESNHLPLTVVHPDVTGGQSCRALSSHIDLVPTLLSFAGVKPDRAGELAGRALPGKDLAPLLAGPGTQAVDAARPATLFTYSGLASNDAGVFDFAAKAAAGRQGSRRRRPSGRASSPTSRSAAMCARPSTAAIASRATSRRSTTTAPATLDELFKWNDVELYDLQADPTELNNLARDRTANAALLETMSGKLEAVIAAEIGKDDGRELPELDGITWGLDKIDL